jgi:hypothetical protein
MDATDYVFPNDPLVVYMCNPFGIEPMKELVRHLELSLVANPRPVFVVYWNAFHPQPFAESQHFTCVSFRGGESAREAWERRME